MHWLFDFDLTLYGHDEYAVLDALDRNITRFIMARFGLTEADADALRHEYWEKYGTTLKGLRAQHNVRPEEYFDFIHNGDQLIVPRFSEEKRQLLLRLPGTKWVFTNARRDWAERGILAMGLADCFAGIFDIEYFGWHSKPDPIVYARLEEQLSAIATELVLVDDRPANLTTARGRGWRTVLVHPEATTQAFDCDLKIASLLELGDAWPQLQNT